MIVTRLMALVVIGSMAIHEVGYGSSNSGIIQVKRAEVLSALKRAVIHEILPSWQLTVTKNVLEYAHLLPYIVDKTRDSESLKRLRPNIELLSFEYCAYDLLPTPTIPPPTNNNTSAKERRVLQGPYNRGLYHLPTGCFEDNAVRDLCIISPEGNYLAFYENNFRSSGRLRVRKVVFGPQDNRFTLQDVGVGTFPVPNEREEVDMRFVNNTDLAVLYSTGVMCIWNTLNNTFRTKTPHRKNVLDLRWAQENVLKLFILDEQHALALAYVGCLGQRDNNQLKGIILKAEEPKKAEITLLDSTDKTQSLNMQVTFIKVLAGNKVIAYNAKQNRCDIFKFSPDWNLIDTTFLENHLSVTTLRNFASDGSYMLHDRHSTNKDAPYSVYSL